MSDKAHFPLPDLNTNQKPTFEEIKSYLDSYDDAQTAYDLSILHCSIDLLHFEKEVETCRSALLDAIKVYGGE